MRAALITLLLGCLLGCAPEGPAEIEGDGLVFVNGEPGAWVPDLGHGPERPSFVEFGMIPFGERVDHTFYLRNDDPTPVVIEKMSASCNCTVPTLLYREADGTAVAGDPTSKGALISVPPGAVLEVTLQIDTNRILQRNIDKYNFVRMTTNSLNTVFVELESHIIVDLAFQATPSPLHLDRIPASGGGSATSEVIRANDTGSRLTGVVLEAPENAVVTVEETWRANLDLWSVRMELLPPLEPGLLQGTLVLEVETVDGQPYFPFEVPWTAYVIPDVEFVPARLHVGTLALGEKGLGKAELVCHLPGHRVRIVDGEVTGDWSDHLELEWLPLETDANSRSPRWELRLTVEPGIQDEVFSGEILLRLDDDQFPTLELPYVGLISSS